MKRENSRDPITIYSLSCGECFKLFGEDTVYMKVTTNRDVAQAVNLDTGELKYHSYDSQIFPVDARYRIH